MAAPIKTNSSYGNWVVWLDNVPHYFWRKSEALSFIESI